MDQGVSSLNWTLTAYPSCEEAKSEKWIRNYNHSKGFAKLFSLKKICHQFVHSVHFSPFVPDGNFCVGFYFVSDYDSKKELYYIQLVNVLMLLSPVIHTMILSTSRDLAWLVIIQSQREK